MFDNIRHNCSQNVEVPANNRLRCRYCKSDMVQLSDGKWDSFICIECGGKCIIYADEKEIPSKDETVSYIILEAYKIVWSKIDIVDTFSSQTQATLKRKEDENGNIYGSTK
jgi:hypothetical protein